MIRLMFIDVDGTLIGASGEVPPAVWAAADRARAAGIQLALCSGRPGFGACRAYAERLDPAASHVFQNGASLLDVRTAASHSTPVDPAIVARLIARARREGHVLELYGDEDYVVESAGPFARGHAELLGVPFAPRPFEAFSAKIVRCQWLASQATAALLSQPQEGLEVIASPSPVMPETTFVNLTAPGVTKASGIVTLGAAAGVPLEDVMFVGDALNDLAGLQVVGVPVAMGNGVPEVKRVAKHIVGDVEAGGLVEAFAIAIESRA